MRPYITSQCMHNGYFRFACRSPHFCCNMQKCAAYNFAIGLRLLHSIFVRFGKAKVNTWISVTSGVGNESNNRFVTQLSRGRRHATRAKHNENLWRPRRKFETSVAQSRIIFTELRRYSTWYWADAIAFTFLFGGLITTAMCAEWMTFHFLSQTDNYFLWSDRRARSTVVP